MTYKKIRKLMGANMDIDLATQDSVEWKQDACPWNVSEGMARHKCAVKNTSICEYFRGVEHKDVVLCCYPPPKKIESKKN